MEHEEYTAENYPSFGKKYANEKAIISLTSWTARINTVSKTLYSLLKQCPGFHIVLVLSEEEFPKMMDELPENLKLFVDNELIEVLWVYKNYRSFKKVLFTMDKYRDVPVISADDDCIYTCNYAQELYDVWKKNPNCVITNNGNKKDGFYWSQGTNTIFPSKLLYKSISHISPKIVHLNNDDAFYGILYKKYKIQMIELKKKNWFIFHDEISPSRIEREKHKGFWNILVYYSQIIK